MERRRGATASMGEGWAGVLAADEVLLWQGRPAPGLSWRGGENATVLLGGCVLALLGVFAWDVWHHADGSEPVVAEGGVGGMVAFAVFGMVLAVSGPLAMRMVRRGTWYTLTSHRAIVAHWPTVWGLTLYRGMDAYPVTEVEVVPSDLPGLWTVHVARLSQRETFDGGWRRAVPVGRGRGRARDPRVGFERLEDAGHVAALCRQVQAATAPQPARPG